LINAAADFPKPLVWSGVPIGGPRIGPPRERGEQACHGRRLRALSGRHHSITVQAATKRACPVIVMRMMHMRKRKKTGLVLEPPLVPR
jgi:hypothetical protein